MASGHMMVNYGHKPRQWQPQQLSDGHKPRRQPQQKMTATRNNTHHCCGHHWLPCHHGHGSWLSVIFCGHYCFTLWPLLTWFMVVIVSACHCTGSMNAQAMTVKINLSRSVGDVIKEVNDGINCEPLRDRLIKQVILMSLRIENKEERRSNGRQNDVACNICVSHPHQLITTENNHTD